MQHVARPSVEFMPCLAKGLEEFWAIALGVNELEMHVFSSLGQGLGLLEQGVIMRLLLQ